MPNLFVFRKKRNVIAAVVYKMFSGVSSYFSGGVKTNAVTKDNTTGALDMDSYGDIAPSRFVPFDTSNKISTYFNGYRRMEAISGMPNLTTIDWTFEISVWFDRNQSESDKTPFYLYGSNNGYHGIGLTLTGGKDLKWYINSLNPVATLPGFNMFNQWVHFAIVRKGTIFTLYINGISSARISSSASMYTYSYNQFGVYNTGYYPFKGNMYGARLVAGYALYDSNFKPSSEPLTNVPGTYLLAFQTSQSTFHLTQFLDLTGNVTLRYQYTTSTEPCQNEVMQDKSILEPTKCYDNYCSVGFDGSSTYSSFTVCDETSLNSDDFTIDFYTYFNVLPTASKSLFSLNESSGGYSGLMLRLDTLGRLSVHVSYTGTSWAIGGSFGGTEGTSQPIPLKQWNHIAVAKDNTSLKVYVNGGLQLVYTLTQNINVSAVLRNQIGMYSTNTASIPKCDMSYFRYVKGVCLYTDNFNFPTSKPAATNETMYIVYTNETDYLKNSNVKVITAGATKNIISRNTVFEKTFKEYPQENGLRSAYFTATYVAQEMVNIDLPLIGTQDFQIDFWIYIEPWNNDGGSPGYLDFINLGDTGSLKVQFLHAGNIKNSISLYSNGTLNSWPDFLVRKWNYVKLTRKGNTSRLFVNGTNVANISSGSTPLNISNTLPTSFGRSTSNGRSILGYVHDLHIQIGNGGNYQDASEAGVVPTSSAVKTPYTKALLFRDTSSIVSSNNSWENKARYPEMIGLPQRMGEPAQGTSSPAQPNGWCVYFPSGSSYSFNHDESVTGQLATYELFFKPMALTGSIINTNIPFLGHSLVNGNLVSDYGNVTIFNSVELGKWHHLVVVKDSSNNNTRVHLDGQLLREVNGPVQFGTGSSNVVIGGLEMLASNLRFSNSIIYNTYFTVPTRKLGYLDSTTKIGLQSFNFVNATNINQYSLIGTPMIKVGDPFVSMVEYDPLVHGGSLVAYTKNDYLKREYCHFHSNDFTIDISVYPRDTNAWIIGNENPNGGSTLRLTNLQVGFYYVHTPILNGPVLNRYTWNQISVCRHKNHIKMWVNGVFCAEAVDNNAYGALSNNGTYGAHSATVDGCDVANLRIVNGTCLYFNNRQDGVVTNKANGGEIFEIDTSLKKEEGNTHTLLHFNNALFKDNSCNVAYYSKGTIRLTTNGSRSPTKPVIKISEGGSNCSLVTKENIKLAGAFTIEAFVKLKTQTNHIVCGDPSGVPTKTTFGMGIFNSIYYNAGNVKGVGLVLSSRNGVGSNMLYTKVYPQLETWTHIAIVRNKLGQYKIFIDGVSQPLFNDNSIVNASIAFGSSSTDGPQGVVEINPSLGSFAGKDGGGAGNQCATGFNGCIDGFAITDGTAKYSSNFDPSKL